MAKRIPALINPDILIWARETAGYTVEDIAAWLKKDPDDVRGWESGEKPLYMGQLRDLANRYKRPLSDFYLPQRPKERPIPHDFRRLPGEIAGRYSPDLRKQLRFARERQEIAEYLYEEKGEKAPQFMHKVSLDDDPEAVGNRVRRLLRVTIDEQASWRDPYAALRAWRSRIEDLGAFVLKFENVDLTEALGFSIFDETFPIIAVNVKLKPRGQTFTMLHEFTHRLLGESSTCDTDDYTTRGSHELRTEMFCNHVAAASLMPQSSFLAHPVVRSRSGASDWEEHEISRIADTFVVSREAAVRRLLTFEKTTLDFYRRKRAEYQAQYKDMRDRERKANKDKPFARGQAQRALSNFGRQFVQIVLESYGDKRITLADAANLLEVRAPNVRKIQELTVEG